MDVTSPTILADERRRAPPVRTREPGPVLVAVPFRQASNGRARPLLSEAESAGLAGISEPVTFRKGAQVCREGDAARFVHIIASGYAKTSRTLPNRTIRVTAFRTAGDLLGLATEGRHVESARAITALSTYRVPLEALAALLGRDGTLGLGLLCKLADLLAAQQHHAAMLGRSDAVGKIAMFLDLIERFQHERGRATDILYLPMSRLDIADYLGLSEAAVSRTLTGLAATGVVEFRTKRQLRILDRARLASLIGGRRTARSDSARARAMHGTTGTDPKVRLPRTQS